MTDTKAALDEAAGSRGRANSSSRGVRSSLVAADLVAGLVGLGASSAIRDPGADVAVGIVVILLSYAVWFAEARLYRSRFITRRADEVRRIVDAGLRTAATVGLVAYLLELRIDRLWLVLAIVFTVGTFSLEREIARHLFSAGRAVGRWSRRVLMVGDNIEADRFAAMFDEEPELGYTIAARIDPAEVRNPKELSSVVLAAAASNDVPGVIIAATAIDMQASNRLIRDLVEAGIHVELTSTLADIASDRLTVRPLGRFPVVYIEPRARGGWRAYAKRTFDLTTAGAALVVLAPLLLAIAVAVRCTSRGPILFRQQRVGKHGSAFEVLKFRTMVQDAEDLLDELAARNEGAGPLFKMADDPRITGVGRFFRKTSLDELPQLWNVVRNEMSLVGPRPALPDEMAEWHEDLYARLRVKPGITGMWQVSGRSATTFEEYTRLDLYYVDNWSLVVDLAILVKTIPAVLKSDGAC
jgi:exopolysaccharide biosynthesis polyprenyl glycosylphosphotransferase